ncbi:MAG: protein-export membrane protein SecD [Candidatus Zambryskibacteria bacterium RIFOXYD1_FULL_40_13]|nr:MAG: Preprotein translocase subunit SecD [Parcubacteria group bacterium GW2011_GWC1_39_12]KKR18952.1 MAG: Preprotein translocase subunit SecD [Parcubacteria group bacterium GW2011_GWF1_39_37]KKR35493.1 MAG: Preprotein translocase subunit SecD [Parcubacteria group bacterium GW2011_GWC2_40_10]KKR51982.1 MAG: Preprotein translocase subunit SecD [Parcubacteria group bacterium GW2011_GWE1_40_20]KKR68483.1 MAG: Preprotein translocase subunit SecD [Parcubacteria group bacterium GW2011_GWF2_40_69]K
MLKHRIISIVLVLVVVGVGFFVSNTSKYPFKFGLDLNGGTELTYRADISKVKSGDVGGAMASLRDVIERRINIFGVSEPIVQVENPGLVAGSDDYRLLVGLPGITNIEEAVKLIGKTPQLEFKLVRPEAEGLTEEELKTKTQDEIFLSTGLDGQYLDSAQLQFTNSGSGQLSGEPIVAITFNDEGRDLFAKITRENLGKVLAIFLDGGVISSPVIRDEIKDGKAVISGGFTPVEAKDLVRDLNYGALPVPVELISTQSIGASLGEDAKTSGVDAGLIGFAFIVAFLILWYRLPGIVASLSLVIYIILSLAVFKLIPVTFTAAGIAGFILSIGMAVDANVLIFERMKEELKKGKSVHDSLHEGFSRAWLSIRDSNISSMITAVILFWLGTSAVKGFALTLGLGVLISLFTAITVSRTFLFAIAPKGESHGKLARFLFSNGFHI